MCQPTECRPNTKLNMHNGRVLSNISKVCFITCIDHRHYTPYMCAFRQYDDNDDDGAFIQTNSTAKEHFHIIFTCIQLILSFIHIFAIRSKEFQMHLLP